MGLGVLNEGVTGGWNGGRDGGRVVDWGGMGRQGGWEHGKMGEGWSREEKGS